MGFAIFRPYDLDQHRALNVFAQQWVRDILDPLGRLHLETHALGEYHIWSKSYPIDHSSAFQARNRHTVPPDHIADLLINEHITAFLAALGVHAFVPWDEGLGWLGFRFVRPGAGDGYPMSRKAWGPARETLSFWIPILGLGPDDTITLVPGSHLKEYEKHLPKETRFRPDEYRLSTPIDEELLFRPSMSPGEVVLFHPELLHSEGIRGGTRTRLSLEMRIQPVADGKGGV
jgi:hypothetical protein